MQTVLCQAGAYFRPFFSSCFLFFDFSVPFIQNIPFPFEEETKKVTVDIVG